MRDIGIPNGLAEVGYGDGDVDDLVAGSLKQQRLLATAPRPSPEDDLADGLPRLDGALVTTPSPRRPTWSPSCAAAASPTSTTRR